MCQFCWLKYDSIDNVATWIVQPNAVFVMSGRLEIRSNLVQMWPNYHEVNVIIVDYIDLRISIPGRTLIIFIIRIIHHFQSIIVVETQFFDRRDEGFMIA